MLPGAGVVPLGHGPLTVKHDPSTRQHARGHGFGWHEPAGMNDTNGGLGHCDHGAMKHVPSGSQQAPKHGFGVHVLPGAGSVPVGHGPTTRKHAPDVAQHAVGVCVGQGIGPHTPPGAGVVPGGQVEPK